MKRPSILPQRIFFWDGRFVRKRIEPEGVKRRKKLYTFKIKRFHFSDRNLFLR